MLSLGILIRKTLKDQGRTVTWFAKKLCCTRPNVYKLFSKDDIDTELLRRICIILNRDFFSCLSHDFKKDLKENKKEED